MLKYAIIFTFLSLLTGALSLTSEAANATGTVKLLFLVSMVFAVLAAQGIRAVRKASS